MSKRSPGATLALTAVAAGIGIGAGLYRVASDKQSAAEFGLGVAASLVALATKLREFVAQEPSDAKPE